ncbi:ATP-binding cassette domain-containing protein [uncultured Duncaniella sp.]|uniref:ATP-binding cassette domain-containing protein n=1 Tax=uncultured Duncaniella sp. TaxID=2768039 RepID=UPI0025E31871|nr:ATP-binding cassette domain-containing protein [uncultured Duncaniella sp.]
MDNNADFLVKFNSPRLGYGNVVLQNPSFTTIPAGVSIILGPNGAGKSTLGLVIEKGRYAYGNRLEFSRPDMKVKMLAFTDIHALTGIEVTRYDQRLEATVNDLVPTVGEILGEKASTKKWKELCDAFSLHDVVSKRVNYLSSGELRKLLIINALIDTPDILILDNPYIGLDAQSRAELDNAISGIAGSGTGIIMLLCDAIDIPAYTTAIITLDNHTLSRPIINPEEIANLRENAVTSSPDISEADLPAPSSSCTDFDVAFAIEDGHVRYGNRSILEGLDWTVRSGERWALTGPNGSGKSLLLSLVCADNPQAYANRITLFDRRRGSGESIWEIKDRIGYVCPEMQLYFRSSLPVEEIVVGGKRNSLSQFRKATPDELDEARTWLRLLDISHLAERKFSELSSGEQRLVLLARTFIKQAPLMILDEPLHGLDAERKERVRRLIDLLITRNRSTLIFVTHYTREIPETVTLTKTLTKL